MSLGTWGFFSSVDLFNGKLGGGLCFSTFFRKGRGKGAGLRINDRRVFWAQLFFKKKKKRFFFQEFLPDGELGTPEGVGFFPGFFTLFPSGTLKDGNPKICNGFISFGGD